MEKGIVPTGQPGIESITKQYLYQLAYQRFIEDHKFSSVKNCFLLPTENNEIEDKGEVRMEMLSNLGLQDIKIRLILQQWHMICIFQEVKWIWKDWIYNNPTRRQFG